MPSAAVLMARVASRPLVRRLADAGLHRYARRRVAALDRCDNSAAQESILLRLVGKARFTSFGRAHDFRRIRSIADYQCRVPLRTYEQFWADYWQPAFPNLRGVTWPGRIPYFALSSGTTTGTTKYVITDQAVPNRLATISPTFS